jgi:hypothetical protein
MARHYDDKIGRRDAFNNALNPFIPQGHWSSEITMTGGPGMSGRIDTALRTQSRVLPLLREDKGELGTDGDPYMQLSRGFQAFVKWKESQKQGMAGVAKFLLTLADMYLMCFFWSLTSLRPYNHNFWWFL